MTPQASPYLTSHDDRVSALTLRFRYAQRSFATVVAKVVVRLVEGAPAVLLPPEPLVTADEHYENAPLRSVRRASEVAPRLLATDVVLSGSAFQPFGNPGTTRVVGLGIHRGGASVLYKTLYVYGDRTVAEPDRVRAFSSMPIVWERAFGGVGVEANPVGVGPSTEGTAALPNVIDPRGATIPGGYGPIGRYWPPRSRLAGQTPRQKLEGLDLEIPEGFPFAYFHAAPVDQRVPFLAGDEWLVLDGMHPLAARIQCRLPGVRAVARLHLPGGALLPVQMMLDMVVIETDRAVCSIVFRGMTDVAVDGAVFAVALDVPQSPLVWPEPAAANVTTVPMRPEGLGSLYDTLSMDDEAQRRAAARAASPYPLPQPRAGAIADLPGAPWAKPALAGVEPGRPDEVTVTLGIDDAPPEARALLGVTPAAEPPDPPVAPPLDPPPPPPPASFREGAAAAPASVEPPVSSIPELETGIRRTVLEKVRAGEALFGQDLSGTDLSGLDLTNAVLADANLTNAKLVGAVLSGARLTGARLVGADLSRACLDGTDLSRADLSRARLIEADLEGATLLDVTAGLVMADRALLGRARLDRAKLMHASLEGAVLDGARARDAELSGANLARVSAIEADLSGALARDIRLDNADLSKVDLSGADLGGASLRDAVLDDCRATAAKLERATLDGVRMARGDLTRANLKRAALGDLRAEQVDLTGADLSQATAERAVFTRACLAAADLRQMRMANANLTEANLDGVQAQKLLANDVKLDGATMTGASFRFARMKRASMRGASVQRADFRDCDMAGADLTDVDRAGANWAGAKL